MKVMSVEEIDKLIFLSTARRYYDVRFDWRHVKDVLGVGRLPPNPLPNGDPLTKLTFFVSLAGCGLYSYVSLPLVLNEHVEFDRLTVLPVVSVEKLGLRDYLWKKST